MPMMDHSILFMHKIKMNGLLGNGILGEQRRAKKNYGVQTVIRHILSLITTNYFEFSTLKTLYDTKTIYDNTNKYWWYMTNFTVANNFKTPEAMWAPNLSSFTSPNWYFGAHIFNEMFKPVTKKKTFTWINFYIRWLRMTLFHEQSDSIK